LSIWDWALVAYARAGVPEACLTLQDRHGQNVPFLLWAVYAEAADPGVLAEASRIARRWNEVAIKPLREARRSLKAADPAVDDAARLGLRDDVKAAELRAERVLLETLERLAGPASGGAHALGALKAASKAWGRPAPDDALAALAAALG
jgi:uncharacterized protein (TIGR02444 family)